MALQLPPSCHAEGVHASMPPCIVQHAARYLVVAIAVSQVHHTQSFVLAHIVTR